MFRYIIIALVLSVVLYFVMRDKAPVAASAEGVIHAPLQKVWETQTDLAGWKDWNKDIESMTVSGKVGLGTVFVWKAGGITIESKITEYVPNKRIAWQGKTTGIDAYHVWEFTKVGADVRVHTEEKFTGFLAWLLPGTMRNQIAKALDHGVEVLKAEAEKGHAKTL